MRVKNVQFVEVRRRQERKKFEEKIKWKKVLIILTSFSIASVTSLANISTA